MTAAERAEKTPDLGWGRAVFADGVTKSDSIERTTDNRMVVVVKDDIVKASSNDSELIKKVREALARFPKVPVKKQVINVGRKAKKETVYSEYTKYIRKNDVQKYNDKMNLLNHPYELVYATTNYINEAPLHKRKDNIVDFARGSVLMMVGNRKYAADVVVAVTRTGKCELYDVVGLDDFVKFDIKKADNSKGGNPQLGKSPENELSTNTIISQTDSSVNTEFMVKVHAVAHIDELVEISKNKESQETIKRIMILQKMDLLIEMCF